MLYRIEFMQRQWVEPTPSTGLVVMSREVIEGPAWRTSNAGPVVPAAVLRWATDEMRARGSHAVEVFSGRPLRLDARGAYTPSAWLSLGVWKAGG